MKKDIKVALVIDELIVSNWKYELIKKVLDEKIAKVCCTIALPKKFVSAKKTRSKIQNLHIKLDKKYYKPSPDAFEEKNLKDLIPEQNNWVADGFEDRLKKENLDFLIWLSDETPKKLFYQNLKYGILNFVHGNEDERFSHFGYDEFMKMKGVFSSALILKKDIADLGKIVYQTWSTMTSLSLSRSRNEHAWKLHSFVPRVLNIFSKEGEKFFSNKPQQLKKENPSNKKSPNEISALINLSNHFCRIVYNFIRKKLYREQWFLLFKNENTPSTSVDDFQKILPPKDRFWADPILVQRENKNYLFLEELLYSNNRGFLSVVEINENGFSGPITPILKKPYHLSYPFIFELEEKFTQDWKSHPQNPIISDVRSARPGGSIYIQDGKIIRPSQDCSKKYGYGINLNEIEILTETEYREKRILHITPENIDKNIRRTHTYAHQNGISIIDGLIQRSKYF